MTLTVTRTFVLYSGDSDNMEELVLIVYIFEGILGTISTGKLFRILVDIMMRVACSVTSDEEGVVNYTSQVLHAERGGGGEGLGEVLIRTSTRSKCVIHYVFSFHFTHAQHSDRITQGTLGTT